MVREQLARHVFSQRIEEFLLRFELFSPLFGLDREQRAHRFASHIEVSQIEILRAWNRADFCIGPTAAPLTPIQNPLQDAHILTKAGPQELAVRALTEPV